MKKYNVIRNYKNFKKDYLYFVVFIKCKDYYYTFDSDAKIMMYLYDVYREDASFRIEKNKFKDVLSKLLDNGLNVVLAGWKVAREYYSENGNNYEKIKKKSKQKHKSTTGSVHFFE